MVNPLPEVAREDNSTSQEAKLQQKLSAVCTLAHVHPFDLESQDRGPVGNLISQAAARLLET